MIEMRHSEHQHVRVKIDVPDRTVTDICDNCGESEARSVLNIMEFRNCPNPFAMTGFLARHMRCPKFVIDPDIDETTVCLIDPANKLPAGSYEGNLGFSMPGLQVPYDTPSDPIPLEDLDEA